MPFAPLRLWPIFMRRKSVVTRLHLLPPNACSIDYADPMNHRPIFLPSLKELPRWVKSLLWGYRLSPPLESVLTMTMQVLRSEERRVGKECKCLLSLYHSVSDDGM